MTVEEKVHLELQANNLSVYYWCGTCTLSSRSFIFFFKKGKKETLLSTYFSMKCDMPFPPIQREQQVSEYEKKGRGRDTRGAEAATAVAAQR